MNLPTNGQRAVPRSRGGKCHSCARDWKTRDAHDMFISSPVQPGPEPGPSPEARREPGLLTTPKNVRHDFHQKETHNVY